MTYEEKYKLYKEEYEIWGFSDYRDRTKLISLITTLTRAAKNKTPDVKPYDVLIKILPDIKRYGRLFEAVSFESDSLIHYKSKVDGYNLNTVPEIVKEIKRILDEWVPF